MGQNNNEFMTMTEDDIRPMDLEQGQKEACRIDIERYQQKIDFFVDVPCPACRSNEAKFLLEKMKCSFVECDSCSTVYMSPRPTPEIMAEYYQNSENYRYWAKYIFPVSDMARRKHLYQPRLNTIIDVCKKNEIKHDTFLEIGAGFGSFADTVKASGFFKNVLVIEPTPEMADSCRKHRLTVIEKRIEDVPADTLKADVIVSCEVVEHLFSPRDFIEKVYSLLSPKGLFYLTCPNGKGFSISTLGSASDSIEMEHINLFNPFSIKGLLKSVGFKDVRVETPGKLDAELVRKAVLEGKASLSSRFLQEILIHRWEEFGAEFQSFLVNYNLSSHMSVFATK